MHDELVMDKLTGELIPATKAIHIYYTVEKHAALDPWTDRYQPTGLDADELIENPLEMFKQAVNV